MKKIPSLWRFGFLVFCLILSLTGGCGGGDSGALNVKNKVKAAQFTPLTVLSSVEGEVLVNPGRNESWTAGNEGMILKAGDKLKTAANGKAIVTFFDGTVFEIENSTEVSLDEIESAAKVNIIKITQEVGETFSRVTRLVDAASRYEIITPAGVAAVRGTKMFVQVASDGATTVYNVEGTVQATAQGQTIDVPAGSNSLIEMNQPPAAPQPGSPANIELEYPGSISSHKGWQEAGLQLTQGDKFYVEYRGGSWSVDFRNFVYVGPEGYEKTVDDSIAQGYEYDASVAYGYLLGRVGDGVVFTIGSKGGPFTADATGPLYLRINDLDASLVDNNGAITVAVRRD